ncbi:TPA: transposase [Escherichia coli]|nr:transposase [Escherichia coli]
MEQRTLSAKPRSSFSNEFKLQMVKLALQPGASVVRLVRKHEDTVLSELYYTMLFYKIPQCE